MQDPVAEVLKYRSDGFKLLDVVLLVPVWWTASLKVRCSCKLRYALIAISTFFAFNILCVVGPSECMFGGGGMPRAQAGSVFAFSKLSHEF